MAISTRSTAIAHCAGAVVMFEARDPLNNVSEEFFHGTCYQWQWHLWRFCSKGNFKRKNSILKILRIFAGLPIALAVIGCALAYLSRAHVDFESACDNFVTRLEKKTSSLGDEKTMGGHNTKCKHHIEPGVSRR